MRGHDIRVLLKKLPPLIPSLFQDDTGNTIKSLWEVCFSGVCSKSMYSIYQQGFDFIRSLISTRDPKEEILQMVQKKVNKLYKIILFTSTYYVKLSTQTKEWVELFLSLASNSEGYQKACVTPYMHMMASHIPDQMRSLNGIIRFSGQGTVFILCLHTFT